MSWTRRMPSPASWCARLERDACLVPRELGTSDGIPIRRLGAATPIADRGREELAFAAVADTVSTNQFKNGMHIELDGGVWRIVEFQHVKPGKGGAFVRTKVKNADTGAVVDRTF